MVNYCIDTSIFIDHFRQKPGKATKLASLPQPFRRYTSAIVVFELARGLSMAKSSTQKLIQAILNAYTIIPVTTSTAFLAGQLDREYQVRSNDALIAATCIENHLTLVTLNSKHYRNIPNLKLCSN